MQTAEAEAVVKTWSELVKSVDVRNVIDVLIQDGIVSLEESEYISKGITTQEQSRRMLVKVVGCSDPATFNIFQTALHEHYPFIVEEINRKLASLKRKRWGKQGRQKAVEVDYDLNVTEFERGLQPVEHGCSFCSMDSGCMCDVNCTGNHSDTETTQSYLAIEQNSTPTEQNSAASAHPPIEHAHSWASPSSSFDAAPPEVRSRSGTFACPPDAATAIKTHFGSFDIGRYQRLSLIPPEFLKQLLPESEGGSGLDATEILRQLSLNERDSGGAPRVPQENGVTPNASFDTRSHHITANGTSSGPVANGRPAIPTEMSFRTYNETDVKSVASEGSIHNGILRPGRRREPTESTETEREDTALKRVVPNGDRVTMQGDPKGGQNKGAEAAQPKANGFYSRISTRFMDVAKKQPKPAMQPRHTNGTNGVTKTVCSTCRHHVLITPHVTNKNTDFGFQLGTTTTTGGFSVEHITKGGPADGRLHPSDIILSINTQGVRGWSKKKAIKKIEATDRQLVLEVESRGEIREHRIGLTLSRSSQEESWGFSMIHGSLRPRYPGDRKFFCTGIDADSPVGRSGLLRVGDVLTGCERESFEGKSQEEVNAVIRSMESLSLHLARKEFIPQGDPRHGHSAC